MKTTDSEPTAKSAIPVWLAYIMLILTAVFWSATAVAVRASAGDIPPHTFTFWRWTVAFLIFLPFAFRPYWQQRSLYKKHWLMMCGLSFAGITGFTIFYFLALQVTTAINASVLSGATPIMIIIVSFVILRIKLTPSIALGTILGIVGSLVIILNGDLSAIATMTFGPGDLLIVAAMTSWAVYTVCLKWLPDGIDPFGLILVLTGLSIPMILPFYVWELSQGQVFDLNIRNIGLILFTAIFPSVVAYLFWNKGVEVTGPNAAGFSSYLIPVFGTILSVLILDETFELFHAAAIALIFAGLYFGMRVPQR
ncbi:MAG: EamA family transporter [Rhodospirillaceae bacterium]|nr:EamA family transporter [Rhodospirillaceae bacterium]|tara:strand:- start:10954 stop:11880 length:927 start_codon:yes stop_codon:yes gene_type:complete